MTVYTTSTDQPDESKITVIKRNVHGQETYRYQGWLLTRHANQIVLQAYFDRQDLVIHGMRLAKGDRFVETYYTDRWYNIFEIHSCEDDALRGWYCNIGQPVQIEGSTISYIDLSLDLLVFPDGRQIVLDEDEFEVLEIPLSVRHQALQALQELQARFNNSSTRPDPAPASLSPPH
jgi:hypothetical protein